MGVPDMDLFAPAFPIKSQHPVLLPWEKSLLLDPTGTSHPLIERRELRLAVWMVSGQPWQRRAYQAKLPNLSAIPVEQGRSLIKNRPGESGLAGVINGKLIHFDALLTGL